MRLIAVCLAGFLGMMAAGAAPGDQPTSPAAPATSSSGLRPLAARFEAEMTDRAGNSLDKTEWYFVREGNRIETIRPSLKLAEIWERDQQDNLSLKRIFHADRRIVEYGAGALRAMHIGPAWSALSSVIDPRVLSRLQRAETVLLPEGTAIVYRGTVDQERVEVWWLEQASLPVHLVREEGDRRLTLRMKSLDAAPPADWPRIDPVLLRAYLTLDATDFGDMHYDPFVRKVERLDAESSAFGELGHGYKH